VWNLSWNWDVVDGGRIPLASVYTHSSQFVFRLGQSCCDWFVLIIFSNPIVSSSSRNDVFFLGWNSQSLEACTSICFNSQVKSWRGSFRTFIMFYYTSQVMMRFISHVHRERPLNGLENGYKIDQRVFWFLVCYAATQLASQLPQRRIQVVRSNKGLRRRSILARCHRAHSGYYLCTPKTDTATLQQDRTIFVFLEKSTKSQEIGPGDLRGFKVSLSGLLLASLRSSGPILFLVDYQGWKRNIRVLKNWARRKSPRHPICLFWNKNG